MIKLYEIDQYLSLTYSAEIKLNNLDERFIIEVSRYYGSYLNDSVFYTSTEIKRNDIKLILNSKPKQI